jgi:hypothetical protein
MVPGKQTVFLLPETSGDLVKRDTLESTHLGLSNLALFTKTTAIKQRFGCWLYGRVTGRT